ncbi:hypothetical protein SteCoe_30525 [Stentor coeruleus]|uniref:Protein kinase domain-containing protein n=1 Tax=Stentor coeruleus TaxID=5963 RepID=A0A1R2B3I1_9CILI|nr:hypothetical protein SteCoe_30525 [Stentor coeruleus]
MGSCLRKKYMTNENAIITSSLIKKVPCDFPEVTLPAENLIISEDFLEIPKFPFLESGLHENSEIYNLLSCESIKDFTVKDLEAEAKKVIKFPPKQKNLLNLIRNESPAKYEEEKKCQDPIQIYKIEEKEQAQVSRLKNIAHIGSSTSPPMKFQKRTNRSLLLTIPRRISAAYGMGPNRQKDYEESSISSASDKISDSNSPSPFYSFPVSKSRPEINLPKINSSKKLFIKAQDLAFCEKYITRSTHVKRTGTIEKKRISKFEVQLNQYHIQGLIGCGGFGKVYKAIDEDGNIVAIKIYNKRVMKSRWVGKSKTALSLIYSEIHVMETAVHPNLITLYEVINKEDHHKIYLVLEYASGGTLQMKGKLKEVTAQKYFKQLIECLEYLHEKLQVIHRDIKPQNILFDSEDNLKLSDFGSAQHLQYGIDEFTFSAGTFAFMAPELHGGSRKFKGKPADIWAAGITLYFMIEDCTPFKSKKFFDLVNEVKTQPIVIPVHLSENLKDLLNKMLCKDPDKRITIEEIKNHPWLINSL